MSAENAIVGALAGLTAGITIGLLVAPEKGSETRRRIADKADHLKYKVQHLFGKGESELEQLKHIFEHEATGLKEDVKERVLKLINESRNTYNNIRQEATGMRG